jgi:hypothetical protein
MTLLRTFGEVLAVVIALFILCSVLGWWTYHEYCRGVKYGFGLGKRDADRWWTGVEKSTQAEQERLWREELRQK